MRACVFFALHPTDRGICGAEPPAGEARAAGGAGGAALATWHLAPVAPPDFFLDPALLEEAKAHGMASGTQI